MISRSPRTAFTLLILTGCAGEPVPPTAQPTLSEKQQLMEVIGTAEEAAPNADIPEPVIALPTLPGWTRSELRPLPPQESGFTVAYDHESGLAVTLYQYAMGLSSIPDGPGSATVRMELQIAKDEIDQAVQLSQWKSAREIETQTVSLGDSSTQALWSPYELTGRNNIVLNSEIYLWAHRNTLLKLRCTGRQKDAAANQQFLRTLLTAIGRLDVAPAAQPE